MVLQIRNTGKRLKVRTDSKKSYSFYNSKHF